MSNPDEKTAIEQLEMAINTGYFDGAQHCLFADVRSRTSRASEKIWDGVPQAEMG
jgi:hypothetical protein